MRRWLAGPLTAASNSAERIAEIAATAQGRGWLGHANSSRRCDAMSLAYVSMITTSTAT